jgi:hypothetical protein
LTTVVLTLPEFIFEAKAHAPEVWQKMAYELVTCANICFDRHMRSTVTGTPPTQRSRRDSSGRVPLMLYAFALENLLKALMVANGEKPTEERTSKSIGPRGRRLAERFTDHRLTVLWQLAGLPNPEPMDVALLEFLTTLGVTGRYPIKVKPDMKNYRLAGDLKGAIVALFEQTDRRIRQAVRLKGRRELNETPRFKSRGLRAPRDVPVTMVVPSPFRTRQRTQR